MSGYADLTGSRFGTVTVTGMAYRHPVPRWNVACHRCGTQWNEGHLRLANSGNAYRCQNASCAAQHEAEQRRLAVHGVPAGPSLEQKTIQAMDVDESNVGLLRAGIQGVQ